MNAARAEMYSNLAATYSVLGFIIGMIAGFILNEHMRAKGKKHMSEEVAGKDNPTPGDTCRYVDGGGAKRTRFESRTHMNKVVGWILMGMALITTLFLVYFAISTRKASACQLQYNNAIAQSVAARSRLADDDRNNLLTLVVGVTNARTVEDSRNALSRYTKEYQRITDQRDKQKLPDPPNCSLPDGTSTS